MSHAHFVRELRALIRAPYALLHLQTSEEERALELLDQLARQLQLPLYDWSLTRGLDGTPHEGDARVALDQIEAFEQPALFIFKDALSAFSSPWCRRRLRELEPRCVQAQKTIIFLGSQDLQWPELDKELTRVLMPLPNRAMIQAECEHTFPPEQFSSQERQVAVSGAMGLTLKEARRAFIRVRQQLDEARTRNAIFDLEEAVLREKQRLLGSNDSLEFFPLQEGMEDVGGLEQLKQWLQERQGAFSQEARDFGLPSPKGLLLVGVQGCGKSLSAKAIARHWALPLLRLDLGRVFEGRKAPEEALRAALQTSEAMSPCVLWLDEIEKGFAQDGDGRSLRVLGSLLTWLQEKSAPVFMVATANQIDALPPELLRKGRFDEIFFVDLPELHERRDILDIHLRRRQRHISPEAIDELAKRCEYFSGAELEQVVISGLYAAFGQRRELTAEDLVYAARETVPLYRTYEEQIKRLRDWASTRARQASRARRVIDYFASPS